MPLPNRAKVSLSRKRAQVLQSQQLQQPKPVESSKITLKRASYSEKQPTRQQENPMFESDDNSQTMVENSNISASFSDYAENSGFSDNIEDYSQLDYSEPNFDSTSKEPNTTDNSGDTSSFNNNDDELSTISPFTVNTSYNSIDFSKYANSNPNTEQAPSTLNNAAENVEIPPISEHNDGSWGEADNSPIDDNASSISENKPDNNNNNNSESLEEEADDDNDSSEDNGNNTDGKNSAGKKASKFMGLKALIAQAKNEIGGKPSDDAETTANRGKNAKTGASMLENSGKMLENGENSLDEQDSAENKDNTENSENPNNSKNAENNGKTGKNGGNAGNNPVLKILKPIIALPLGAIRLVLRVLSVCFHGVYAIISSLGTILVLWAICNIPSIMLNTGADFEQDEGTTTVSNIKYDGKTGRIDAKIANSSDMIAHVDVGGELVSWQPFAKLPFSLFLPQQTGQCSNITISQINPDETRNITIQCSNAQGIWVRPKVVMKGI